MRGPPPVRGAAGARRLGRLVGVVLFGLVGTIAPALAPAAGADEGTVVDLLVRAREAARTEAYRGTMVVEWHDGRRVRTARVAVDCAGGVMRFGDDVAGDGAHRLVRSPAGWQTLWRHDVIALGPSPARKYSLSTASGPEIAGHPTDVVEVRLRAGGPVRERVYLHRDSGLALRQELLDARGRPYRSVGFLEVHASEGAPTAPKSSRDREPARAGAVGSRYRAPKQLGKGYRLVGSYAPSAKLLHLFYSDGLHGLSVFEQRGRLTQRSMPEGGRTVELAGSEVRSYSTSVGEAVIWEGEGVVYTVVSDAHRDDVAAAVAGLSHAGGPGRLQQVAEAVAALFRWR